MSEMISHAQLRVMALAASRPEPHYICPTPGLYAAAQRRVLQSLKRHGFITDMDVPRLTPRGLEYISGPIVMVGKIDMR